ncbi:MULTISPECIES: metal ABC transporter substrate-binding protein [Methylobacterium]|uniref:metal ABC transporter substrate-binding protein n=1 Tax=Methylobacterium TaxID=407 RepID=UPI001FDFCF82|nr:MULTISPECIES: metal ABC transporter substrate-binding protein [Methylobacterium]MDR7040640.1 zinc/manganese transport system substrate-binding protein [Methylobacterium sp. BE186]
MGAWKARMFGAGLALALAGLIPGGGAEAAERLRAVATFSILGDLLRQVGGERVEVATLVGPDADAHGYSPAPGDGRILARADIVVVNGLGFEGWLDRLIRASGAKAPVIVAARGVTTIAARHDHAGEHDHADGGGTGQGGGTGEGADPHAWQSIANAKVYVANLRDGLAKADPAHAEDYARNAAAYLAQLDALDGEVRAAIAAIPPEHRRVITTHDAFGYFGAAYGLRFIAPQGVANDSEASPRSVARIIRQIRQEQVPAVFLETIADPRLMEQIARESGAKIGGRIYSDALSGPAGPAPTYLDMMRSNLREFSAALARS